MKKRCIFLLAIICVFFISGCSTFTKKDSKTLEIEASLNEAEEYEKKDDLDGAIQKYEYISRISNDPKYESKVQELRTKQKNGEDIIMVNQAIDELKNVLLNPDSLQVNKVIICRNSKTVSHAYLDYSAMNKMGGYCRDYAYAVFFKKEIDASTFSTSNKSYYRNAEENLDKDNTYYFDVNLLKKNVKN